MAIVVAGQCWFEISLWKLGKAGRQKKEQRKKEEREMVSQQPSSTAENR